MATYAFSHRIPKIDAEFLFKAKIYVNSIIQLKDGKLLMFCFSCLYTIYIYNEKTFQKLFEIDLYESISEYEKRRGIDFKDWYNKNKNSIKELSSGLILIGRNKYLIELNIKRKEYKLKIVKTLDNIILDINELSDKRIIVITDEKILILKTEDEEYIIKEEYLIKKNWKMKCHSLEDKSYSRFRQYYTSNELPNNRLLLNSFSFERQKIKSRCLILPPIDLLNSKIILIDLNNFEEIKSTEIFDSHVNITIMENIIIIQSIKRIYIHDINSFKLIQNDLYSKRYGIIFKFNKEYVISFCDEDKENKSLIFSKIEDNYLVKYGKIIKDSLKKLNSWDFGETIKYGKYILILKNRRIIILNDCKIIILQLDKDL